MREIKFRAWATDEEKLLQWGAIMTHSLLQMVTDKRLIVQQYTGLKDKNGKEIYEGDILQDSHTEYSGVGAVRWEGLGFVYTKTFGHIFCAANTKCFEVIGNIYENKELLDK